MTALIIGNGDVSEMAKEILPENSYVICADGGVRHLRKLELEADVVIGDMDSAGDTPIGENVIRYPVRKNFTDGEIAVDYALEKGFSEIVMIGFIGTRLDHTLTNIFLMKKISEKGVKCRIIDDNNVIYYGKEENIISGKAGDLLSIIPVGDAISGITTEGLEYPLNDEVLEFGKSRGVSNVMTGDECKIFIKSGIALIIKSKD